LAHIK